MRPIDGDRIVEIAEIGQAKFGIGNKPRKYLDWPQLKYIAEKCPTLDVAPVRHGKWIYHVDDLFPGESTQECSVCHKYEYMTLCNENYCPNCGARMQDVEGNDGREV